MFVVAFEVVGFLGREIPVELRFNRDLNIVTGRNGAGKTSLLKLMWYIMSGNILEALREVDFQKATLTTSEYRCTVYRLTRNTCRVDIESEDGEHTFEDVEDEDGDIVRNAEDSAGEVLIDKGGSIFFPTFRRIEGGFTMDSARRTNLLPRRVVKRGEVEEALAALSQRLSNGSHKFVAAISTVDVIDLLQRTYTNLSERYNELQRTMSQDIVDVIRNFQVTGVADTGHDSAEDLLGSIRLKIESVESSRDQIMIPIESIQKIVQKLFQHKGIKLGHLNFGEATEAINSDLLSAGEKQMLSFVSYNGLAENVPIFIDEPELSLHVDWQRKLFSTLMRQRSGNQFIIATHSPFIYSKYPDKELLVGNDRGDRGE